MINFPALLISEMCQIIHFARQMSCNNNFPCPVLEKFKIVSIVLWGKTYSTLCSFHLTNVSLPCHFHGVVSPSFLSNSKCKEKVPLSFPPPKNCFSVEQTSMWILPECKNVDLLHDKNQPLSLLLILTIFTFYLFLFHWYHTFPSLTSF